MIKRRNLKAIKARIDLVAVERGIPESQVQRAKLSAVAAIDFALDNNLSIDWLLYGDLRGRLRQAQGLYADDAA